MPAMTYAPPHNGHVNSGAKCFSFVILDGMLLPEGVLKYCHRWLAREDCQADVNLSLNGHAP